MFLGSLGLFNQTKTQCLDWPEKLQLFFGKYLPFLLQGTSEINRQTCPLHREKSTSTSVWWVGNYESFLHQKINSIFFFFFFAWEVPWPPLFGREQSDQQTRPLVFLHHLASCKMGSFNEMGLLAFTR